MRARRRRRRRRRRCFDSLANRRATGSTCSRFGEIAGARPTPASLRAPPKGEATRIGETLAELRGRYAGRDLGAVVIVSDGIDTGRVGRGPLDGETRKTLEALGAPVHTVLVGE